MKINQRLFDVGINAHYIGNARLAVHIDGMPASGSSVVLHPRGLSARAGDRIEFLSGNVDPS